MLAWLAGEGRRAHRRGVRARRAASAGAGARAAERARLLCLRAPCRGRRAAARPGDRAALVRGAGLLLLQPGLDPRAGRAAAPARRRPPMLDFELEIAAVIGVARRRARDRRLHADERLVGARRAGGRDDRRPRPGEGQGLRHQPRALARHARRAALRGRAAADRRPGRGQRRAGDRAPTPPSSTSAGPRSSRTRPATPACGPATCSARARLPAAACSSSGRSTAAGRPEGRWIEPGDVVALEADGLGTAGDPGR